MKFCFGFIFCFCLVSNLSLPTAEAQANLTARSGSSAIKQVNNTAPCAESKELNELKKRLKESDQKIEELNKSLRQQSSIRQELEESSNNQKNLLLNEQQRLVEELINNRQKLGEFIKGSTRSSEREYFLAQELEKSLKNENEAVKKTAEIKEAHTAIDHLIKANESIKKQMSDKENELALIVSQKRKVEESLKSVTNEIDKQTSAQSANFETIAKKDKRIEQLQSELQQANQIVKALQLEVEAKKQLEERVQRLDRELTEARNLIMLKETELEILNKSGVTDNSRLPNIRNNPVAQPNQNTNQYNYPSMQRRPPAGNPKSIGQADLNSDVMIVTVIEDKVNLRSGPGHEHAPMMQVQRGSRLTVEARQGDWYSVITPTGSRAFVHRDSVTSGQLPAGPAKPVSRNWSPGVGNVDNSQDPSADEERRAFEALRNSFAKP